MTEPSPLTDDEVPFVDDIIYYSDGLKDWSHNLSKVIWSVAPESIIHSFLLLIVEVWKTLPDSSLVCVEGTWCSATDYSLVVRLVIILIEGCSVTATKAWVFGFEFRLRGALAGSHHYGYPISS